MLQRGAVGDWVFATAFICPLPSLRPTGGYYWLDLEGLVKVSKLVGMCSVSPDMGLPSPKSLVVSQYQHCIHVFFSGDGIAV